jgi:hypothetical protein
MFKWNSFVESFLGKFMNKFIWILLITSLTGITPTMAEGLSAGQALYLPIYSKIWHGDRIAEEKYPIDNLLSALISMRNTSLKTPIKVISARYYNTDGKILKEYIEKPSIIVPMGTLELFVERKESEGGSGANFIILWESVTPTNPPIVEAVHADIRNGLKSIVFTTTARPIQIDK